MEKRVVQVINFTKNYRPSDFLTSSQPKSIANCLMASAVNFPADARHFFILTTARLVAGVSETISGSESMSEKEHRKIQWAQ